MELSSHFLFASTSWSIEGLDKGILFPKSIIYFSVSSKEKLIFLRSPNFLASSAHWIDTSVMSLSFKISPMVFLKTEQGPL